MSQRVDAPAGRTSETDREAYAARLAAASWDQPNAPTDRPGSTTAALNRLSDLAARLLHTGSAQVSLIADEQHVVGGAGTARPLVGDHSPAADSLCSLTTREQAPVSVPEAATDERVRALPPVTSGTVGAYLGVPLVAANGLVVGAFCVYDNAARDWTPQDVALLEELARPALAELELAALLAEYQDDRVIWELAVDAAGVGAFDWHLATDELRWDDRLLELFGLDRTTFGGNIGAFNESVHPEDRERVSAALARAIDTCGPYDAEYRVIHPGGEVRWIAARGMVLAGPEGEAVKLVGAAYDTTAVRDADARVARVLETMPSAFYQLDREWRFAFVNTEGVRVLGMSLDELLGGSIWELFPATLASTVEERFRHAVRTGAPVEFETYYPAPLNGWFELRAWPSPDGLAVYFYDTTARHRAQEQLDFAARRSEILADLTGALTGTLDIEEAVRTLAPIVVPDLADWCLVTAASDSPSLDWREGLRDIGHWHVDPDQRELVRQYAGTRLPGLADESYSARALKSEVPVVIPGNAAESILDMMPPGEAHRLLGELAPASAVVVPLRGRTGTVGLLTLFRGDGRPSFSEDDLILLEDVGVRAGLAMDNARLFREQREVAETLQRSLLSAPMHRDDLEVAVRYVPAADAAQVGGDWYDSFCPADGSTVVVIGDVVGHDMTAAAEMGQIRSLVRGIAVHSDHGPADLLRGVDQAMRSLVVETTATAVVARLDARDDGAFNLRWSNAGHPPPALVRRDGTVTLLEPPQSDLLLGLEPDVPRQEHELVLQPGDTLVLCTDGLVERRLTDIDTGLARLTAALSALGPEAPVEEIAHRLVADLSTDVAEDDVALLVVRLRR